MSYDFDVGIIGGGPAGSTCASYLARAGLKVGVFEQALFPRPHVGESLVPTVNRYFQDLGLFEKMEAHKFPHKYGAVWTTSANSPVYEHGFEGMELASNSSIRFEERPQEGLEGEAARHTYHVDRGKFDLMLLQHAHELGADVHEGLRVREVDFSRPGEPVISYRVGRTTCRSRVRAVVDASGRRTLLGNQLKLRTRDPYFNQYALHTWFEGYDRTVMAKNKNQDKYIFIHFMPVNNTWLWQIPITDTITSIGVVTPKENFARARAERQQFFWDTLKSRPELYEALQAAQQMHPLREEADYSYSMSQVSGDNYVMVGDAARFVDPIFSSGVSIAMSCGCFAAHDLIAAAEKGDFSAGAFSTYNAKLANGVKNWYQFITLYYRLNLLFTAFLQDERYRLDIIRLLQGDVYDEGGSPALEAMARTVREVENNPNHLWHRSLNQLTARV